MTEIHLLDPPTTDPHFQRTMTVLQGATGCIVAPDRSTVYAFEDDHILIADQMARECRVRSTIRVLD